MMQILFICKAAMSILVIAEIVYSQSLPSLNARYLKLAGSGATVDQYIRLAAPILNGGSYTLTLPPSLGSAGNALRLDANGVLEWFTPGDGGSFSLNIGSTLTGDGDATPLNVAANTTNQRVEVLNNGTSIGTRKSINFIPGSNISYTIADNSGSDRVDVTINSSGGGGGTGVEYNVASGSPQNTATSSNTLFNVKYASTTGDVTLPGATINSTATSGNSNATGLSITSVASGTGIAKGLVVSATGSSATNGNIAATFSGLTGFGTTSPTQMVEIKDGHLLLSNSGSARQLQFKGTGSGITTLEAGAQGANTINYILPTTVPIEGQVLSAIDTSGSDPYIVTTEWVSKPVAIYGGNSAINTTDGDYYCPYGIYQPQSETQAYIIATRSGTLKNLYFRLSASPGSGKSKTLTVRVNGSNTTLAVTVSGASTSGSNTNTTVTYSAGDRISLILNHTGGPTASSISWGFEAY